MPRKPSSRRVAEPIARPTPHRVFLSSTFRDNEARRDVIIDTIAMVGMVPCAMELFTAVADTTRVAATREQIASCDVLLLLVAWRYGWIPDGHDRSITELEYEWACEQGIPRLVFIVDEARPVIVAKDFDDEPERWRKQERLEAFKARLRAGETPGGFTDQNLSGRVSHALHQWRQSLGDVAPHDPGVPTIDPGTGNGQAPPIPSTPPEGAPADLSSPAPARRKRHTPRPRRAIDRGLSRYLDVVERDNAKTTMLGPAAPVAVPLRLEGLRTRVRVAPRRASSVGDGAALHEPEPELALHDVLSHAEQQGCRVVVLVGHPGSGKSTHLRRLALWLSRRSAATLGLPVDTVPVLLSLPTLSPESGTLREAVAAHLRADPRLEPGFVDELLAREHLVFLLDGLDEASDDQWRARVVRWVEDGLRDHPGARAMITRRPSEHATAEPEPAGWLEVQLPPLPETDARRLVRRWFRATRGDATEETAEQRADALWAELRAPELRTARMFELTRNPLLLTTLCVLHGRRDRLPTRRVELYEECVQVLLQRWRDAVASLPRRFGEREARLVLQPLAHWLHEGRRTHADARELAAVIEPHLRVTLGPDCDPVGFLRTIGDADGLLTGKAGGTYGFLHLGFQEYLCARQLRALSHGDPAVLDRLAERLGDPWWREVTLLLLALGEPALFEPFMRSVVERPAFVEHQDWILDCIQDAVEVTDAPFVELLERPPVDDPALWKRQLAAWRVLQSFRPERLPAIAEGLRTHPLDELRRLAGHDDRRDPVVVRTAKGAYALVEIPAGRFVMGSHHREGGRRGGEGPQHEVELSRFFMGKHPVTNEDYGSYLRDCPDVPEPAYWGDPRYNQPHQPVVGVSWHEAAAYCEWAGLALPTEAQWEYACRAGTRGPYWSGRKPADLDRIGWYAGNSGERLHAVGEKDPSPFGLHDMHGNVWEWCRDGFGVYEGHPPRPGDGLRHAPQDGGNRMIRGGSWIDDAHAARSAYRLNRHPDNRLSYLGFRAVKLVDPDDA